ncbi:MAG: ABC transporter, partial [Microcoleaceae cyanobacterium]
PGDEDVIVVASPQRKLFEGEVEALENFLNQGKGILLMLDPKTNHGLEDLLDDWGVKLDDRLAIDATGRGNLVGLGPTEPIVQEYGDHPITQDFGNGISVYPYARSVETRPISGVTENPLIWTDGQSWAESDLTGEELVFDPERDRQGPLSLGVALTREAQLLSNDSSSEVTTETPETNQADTEGVTNNAEAGSETSELVSTEEAEQLEADLEADVEPDVEPDIEPESPSSNVAEETEPESQEAETNSENAETDPEDSVENSAANSEAEARLVVIGNSQFATNGWFDQQLNGDVFLNTVNWLSQPDQETFSIRPKPVTNRRIVLTPALGRALGWTALVIWPLLGFAMAGFLWWRRMA